MRAIRKLTALFAVPVFVTLLVGRWALGWEGAWLVAVWGYSQCGWALVWLVTTGFQDKDGDQ